MTSENTKPQPVLIASAILAVLTTISGGVAALGFDQKGVGLASLVIAGLNVGFGLYVRDRVVPLSDTAAYVNDVGAVIAGPAAPVDVGLPVTVVHDPAPE